MDYAAEVEKFELAFHALHQRIEDPANDEGGIPPVPDGVDLPTRYWTPAKLSPDQYGYVFSRAGVNASDCGRRAFKSQGLLRRVARHGCSTSAGNESGFLCGPTESQSKRLLWKPLKKLIPPWAFKGGSKVKACSESDMTVTLWNDTTIRVAGLDKPERIEGESWDFGGITEFGNCKPGILDEHIWPMLTKDGAWIDVEGTPDLGAVEYRRFVDQVDQGLLEDAVHHHWSSEDVFHLWVGKERAEKWLRKQRNTLSPRMYRQEILGQWVSAAERAYAEFSAEDHVLDSLEYDPSLPLIIALDFNVAPGTGSILQEQRNGGRWKHIAEEFTAVIDEVWIQDDSTTRKVCDEILRRYRNHRGLVYLYGDPAGGARKTVSEGNDWSIVRGKLKPVFGDNLKSRVATSHPSIRSSVNAVEQRMRTYSGEIHFAVSAECKHTRTDYEGTTWSHIETPEGKKKAGDLTHLTDGIRYYVAKRWPASKVTSRAIRVR